MKIWNLEEPTPRDQVYLRCTQRESVTQESNVKTKSDWFVKIRTTDTQDV